ncbi:hypothetical protein CMUS01_15717 [Colletotrichum musicola]|uniref:Uncharacterized protein n=1 Tax=Colletotrichum musicola TaxID=2175873 RepID=A0A8H6ML90_9PEZI|nr:hypothetical protein CMUS01_15717 [Colletotrichum musicola]
MSHTRPHLVTGNHARHSSPLLLARDLFDWTKQDRVLSLRKGWNAKPFRVATRVAYDAVQANFGTQQAASWLEALHHLVVLTRWILPWPSESALFDTTKQQRGKNKFRRLMWFSTIYSPERIQPSGRVNHDPRGIPVEDRTHYFTSNDQLSDWTNSMMDDLFFSKGWLDPEDNTQPRFFIRAGDIISKVTSDHTKPLDFIYSPALSCGRAVDGHPNAKNGQPYPLVDPGRPPQLLMVHAIRGRTIKELDHVFQRLMDAVPAGGDPRTNAIQQVLEKAMTTQPDMAEDEPPVDTHPPQRPARMSTRVRKIQASPAVGLGYLLPRLRNNHKSATNNDFTTGKTNTTVKHATAKETRPRRCRTGEFPISRNSTHGYQLSITSPHLRSPIRHVG